MQWLTPADTNIIEFRFVVVPHSVEDISQRTLCVSLALFFSFHSCFCCCCCSGCHFALFFHGVLEVWCVLLFLYLLHHGSFAVKVFVRRYQFLFRPFSVQLHCNTHSACKVNGFTINGKWQIMNFEFNFSHHHHCPFQIDYDFHFEWTRKCNSIYSMDFLWKILCLPSSVYALYAAWWDLTICIGMTSLTFNRKITRWLRITRINVYEVTLVERSKYNS